MKIAAINAETNYFEKSNLVNYLERVSDVALNSGADLVVGPELAIANFENIMSNKQFDSFIQSLKSSVGRNQVVAPGTAIVYNEVERTLRNRAPVICGDGRVHIFDKKSSVEEEGIANYADLEYVRGKSSEGFFEFQGRVYSLEICRDHGHAKLQAASKKKSDLGLVLASNGAFYPSKSVVKDGGLAVVVDGNLQKGSGIFQNNSGSFEEIEPHKINGTHSFWEI